MKGGMRASRLLCGTWEPVAPMRSTGAELRVVVMKVLQWRWSEGATLSGFIDRSTAMREEPYKAKPFTGWTVGAG